MQILTPVRRQLTAQAKRRIIAIARCYHDGGTGQAAIMGVGIKRGMIIRRLEQIAKREERIPSGIVQVPPRGEREGPPPYCAMAGFEVNVDDLIDRLSAGPASRRA